MPGRALTRHDRRHTLHDGLFTDINSRTISLAVDTSPTLLKAPAHLVAAHGPSVSVRAAGEVIRYAARHGAQPEVLLAAAGLLPKALDDPDGRLSRAAMSALWEAAAHATGDADFGLHLSTHVHPDALSIVGFVMMNEPTLGAALRALTRFFALVTEGIVPHLHTGGADHHAAFTLDGYSVAWRASEDGVRHPVECTLAALMPITRALTGRRLPVRTVAFAHATPPTGTATHEAIFGVPPRFSAPADRLTFERGALQWPVVTASPHLLDLLEHEADEQLDVLSGSFRTRVAGLIRSGLRGAVPTLVEVAHQLHVGERTLQRRLQAEGTSFRALTDASRRAVAEHHLAHSQTTIHEVAFLLGFSEPSAFHRAFKRWTGLTPTVYRERSRHQHG